MTMFLKTAIGVGIALTLAAFVVGSLVAVSDQPAPRERIVIRDDPEPSEGPQVEPRNSTEPGREPTPDSPELDDDTGAGDDDTDDRGTEGGPGRGAADQDDARDDGSSDAGDTSGGSGDDTGDDDD